MFRSVSLPVMINLSVLLFSVTVLRMDDEHNVNWNDKGFKARFELKRPLQDETSSEVIEQTCDTQGCN